MFHFRHAVFFVFIMHGLIYVVQTQSYSLCYNESVSEKLPVATFCSDSEAYGTHVVLDGYYANSIPDEICSCVADGSNSSKLVMTNANYLTSPLQSFCGSAIRMSQGESTVRIECSAVGPMTLTSDDNIEIKLQKETTPKDTRYCVIVSFENNIPMKIQCFSNKRPTTVDTAHSTEFERTSARQTTISESTINSSNSNDWTTNSIDNTGKSSNHTLSWRTIRTESRTSMSTSIASTDKASKVTTASHHIPLSTTPERSFETSKEDIGLSTNTTTDNRVIEPSSEKANYASTTSSGPTTISTMITTSTSSESNVPLRTLTETSVNVETTSKSTLLGETSEASTHSNRLGTTVDVITDIGSITESNVRTDINKFSTKVNTQERQSSTESTTIHDRTKVNTQERQSSTESTTIHDQTEMSRTGYTVANDISKTHFTTTYDRTEISRTTVYDGSEISTTELTTASAGSEMSTQESTTPTDMNNSNNIFTESATTHDARNTNASPVTKTTDLETGHTTVHDKRYWSTESSSVKPVSDFNTMPQSSTIYDTKMSTTANTHSTSAIDHFTKLSTESSYNDITSFRTEFITLISKLSTQSSSNTVGERQTALSSHISTETTSDKSSFTNSGNNLMTESSEVTTVFSEPSTSSIIDDFSVVTHTDDAGSTKNSRGSSEHITLQETGISSSQALSTTVTTTEQFTKDQTSTTTANMKTDLSTETDTVVTRTEKLTFSTGIISTLKDEDDETTTKSPVASTVDGDYTTGAQERSLSTQPDENIPQNTIEYRDLYIGVGIGCGLVVTAVVIIIYATSRKRSSSDKDLESDLHFVHYREKSNTINAKNNSSEGHYDVSKDRDADAEITGNAERDVPIYAVVDKSNQAGHKRDSYLTFNVAQYNEFEGTKL